MAQTPRPTNVQAQAQAEEASLMNMDGMCTTPHTSVRYLLPFLLPRCYPSSPINHYLTLLCHRKCALGRSAAVSREAVARAKKKCADFV